jgi:3-dehydroquinate dehydratase-2
LEEKAREKQFELETFQSNGEGEIIDRLQKAYYDQVDGIVINPGAYTHYSYAIRDALSSLAIPKIEVHISNIHQREEFRHTSVTAPVCTGQIAGLGLQGYLLAIEAIIELSAKA